ncbi:MAG: hypothetical protein WA477_12220 [Candidatus Sulfotelmatobacter sp.]
MKILSASTPHAAALIALPNFKLNRRRDDAIVIEIPFRGRFQQWLIENLKLEFEHLASIGGLLPSIYQSEKTVVDPYAIANLLKDSHQLSARPPQFVAPDRI